MDLPLPGRLFGGRELVVVAAGKGLKGDQGRVVLKQDWDARSSVDLGLSGSAHHAFPTEAGAVEPVGQLDPAEGAAAVEDLGEGGGAAPGCG
jgi:hypothetical protein